MNLQTSLFGLGAYIGLRFGDADPRPPEPSAMTAEEFSAQLTDAENALKAAVSFINALWMAYDSKPAVVGIDPAAVQPAVDNLKSAATDLVNAINARPIP